MLKDTNGTSEPASTTGKSEAAADKVDQKTDAGGSGKKAKAKPKKGGSFSAAAPPASAPAAAAPQSAYNYVQQLGRSLGAQARNLTEKIKKGLRRTGEEVCEMGKDLLKIKALLGHGRYGLWRDAEFPGHERSFSEWMAIAAVFDGKSEPLQSLSPTALAPLAHCDAEIREQVLVLIKAGTIVTVQQIKDAIREAAEAHRSIGAPHEMLGSADREPAERRAEPNAKKIARSSPMSAAPEGKAARTLTTLLLDLVRPQIVDLIEGVKAVTRCLGTAIETKGTDNDMRVSDVREEVERALPALYRLAGTNPETEASPTPRLAGPWQTIERTLHRLGKQLEDGTAGTALHAELLDAQSELERMPQ